MRRFKSKIFKKKKSKVIIKRRRHRIPKEDLKEWEDGQIKLAIEEALIRKKKRLIFVEHPIIIQSIPKIYSLPTSPTTQDLQKLLSVKHLLNSASELVYWGRLPITERPKPRLINGHHSPEDIIFNPENNTDRRLSTEREIAFSKKRTQLFRRLGFSEDREVITVSYGTPLDISKKDIKRQIRKNDRWRVYPDFGSTLSNTSISEKKEVKPYTVIQMNGDVYETKSKEKAIAKAKHNAILRHYTPGQKVIVTKFRIKIHHGKKELKEIGKQLSQIY